MLIGRTKHILYIKIQASSDNNRINFFKNRRKKKTNILVMCYGVSCFCFKSNQIKFIQSQTYIAINMGCLYVYTIKVRVYCHKIDCPLQLSVPIIGALASLIRLMLRDNAISRLR